MNSNFRDLRVYRYNCVSPNSLKELQYIIDNSKEITYKTFRNNVNKDSLYQLLIELCYTDKLKIQNDWAVRFYKSKLPSGKIVYYINHSAIEYIFY